MNEPLSAEAIPDDVKAAMPYTTAFPQLGTGPIDVEPIISPELFEVERERIFKRVWLKVGRVEEIAEPGDYKIKRLHFAKTAALIIRGKDGVIRAFHNLCTHRGNKLVPGNDDEKFGKARGHALTCRFHAWTFNSDGSLRAAARQDRFANFDKSCLGLKPIHCDIWEGFIFLNLDETPRWTLAEFLGGLGEHYGGFPYGEATTTYRYSTVLECNWKVCMYAFAEGYHVATIHQNTLPSLARIEHKDFKLYGPHSTSSLYVDPGADVEPTPATGNLGGLLKTSELHGPRLHEMPELMNASRRDDIVFEYPVFFPTCCCTCAPVTATRAWSIFITNSGRFPSIRRCGKARISSARRARPANALPSLTRLRCIAMPGSKIRAQWKTRTRPCRPAF